MARSNKRPTDEEIADALRATSGLIMLAAHRLGVHRTTLWRWMEASPELRAIADEETEVILDIAEGHVITAIKSGDLEQAWRYLRCKGRKRGYGDKTDIDVTSAGKPLGEMSADEIERKALEILSRRVGDSANVARSKD